MARQPVTFCLQQQKVTKKCRNLTTKLEHDGCISQGFLSSSFRGFIAKRYRRYFFCAAFASNLTSDFSFEQNSSSTLFFPFERHAELNSKNRPLGTFFTCSKIKRSLLNLFVVTSLCFEKSAATQWCWLEASSDIDDQLSRVKRVYVGSVPMYWIKLPQSE